jgi:hypothetical protein
MFVPHVLGFLPPPVVESVVSRGSRRGEKSGSLYLADPIAIIEVRWEEVLSSTLDRDRMWRRGTGVLGDSELCFRVWFGTYGDDFFNASLLLHRKPELLPWHFSYPLELGHLKLHTVSDVNLSHSLGIDLWVCRIELGVIVRVRGIHKGKVGLLRSRIPMGKIEDEDFEALATATQDFHMSLSPRGLY